MKKMGDIHSRVQLNFVYQKKFRYASLNRFEITKNYLYNLKQPSLLCIFLELAYTCTLGVGEGEYVCNLLENACGAFDQILTLNVETNSSNLQSNK